jgi:hypothetical protein
MPRPLDRTVPLAGHQNNGEFFQGFWHGALKTQLCPEGGQIARGLGAVQERPELQAHLRSVAVLTNTVVDRLSFRIQLIA